MIEWLYLKLFPPKNSEENQEQQKMSFKLTPLDSFSVNFINIDNLNIDISHLQSAIPAIKSTIKQLQNKLDSLNKSQSKYLKSQLTDLNDSHKKNFISDEARTNAIMIHLYNKSLDKLKKRQINFHEQSIHYCNQMIEFVQNTIDNNYPIRIDYNGFIQKVNDYQKVYYEYKNIHFNISNRRRKIIFLFHKSCSYCINSVMRRHFSGNIKRNNPRKQKSMRLILCYFNLVPTLFPILHSIIFPPNLGHLFK